MLPPGFGYVRKKNHCGGRKERGMNLKAKVYVENQKKRIEEKLKARLALLKEKGQKEDVIQRDAGVRQLKAQVRKMDYRLAAIAAQEKLNRERAQAKMERLAAEKAAREAPQEEAPKKEPEKKEKKGKKEKAEKPPKAEGKAQGKPAGKAEGQGEEEKGKKEKPEKAEKKPKNAAG
jgi:hypothetical protein